MTSFILRSVDRHQSSISSSNCKFLLTTNGLRRGERKYAQLEYAICLNTPYTIQAGINDSIDFNENSTNKTATLTPGVYSATALAAEIQADLNTASAPYNTYTVAYSTVSRKLTFTATYPFTLLFNSGSHAATSPWRECGFIASSGASSAVNSSTGTSVTAPFPVNLSLPLSWFVQMAPLSGSTLTTASGSPFTWYLPMSASAGGIMEFKANSVFPQRAELPNDSQLNNWTVQFVNSSGSSINLQGAEWEIVLTLC